MKITEKHKAIEEGLKDIDGLEFVIDTGIVTHHATMEEPEETLEVCITGDDASEALAFLYSTRPEVTESINRAVQPLACAGALHKDLVRYTLQDHPVILENLEPWGDLLLDDGFLETEI